jgi:hypothetical protein
MAPIKKNYMCRLHYPQRISVYDRAKRKICDRPYVYWLNYQNFRVIVELQARFCQIVVVVHTYETLSVGYCLISWNRF